MRFAVFFLLMAASAAPATQTSVSEKQLRARAGKFYTFLVAKQYRQSETFIDPADRDTYYAMEKPNIFDFEIRKVTIEKGKTAELQMESTTVVRRPMVGEMKIQLSYLSHWKLKNGEWFWYVPVQETRQTPFGPMTFKKQGLGTENQATIKTKMAQAPTPAELLTAVKPDVTSVTLGANPGDDALVILRNTLPGGVGFELISPKDALYTVELWPRQLTAAGDRATVKVQRVKPGPIPSGSALSITVKPTNQQISIGVK